MPFDTKTNEQLKVLLAAAEKADTNAYRADYALAINYYEGRQIRDVAQQLQQRYSLAQSGAKGETIAPIAIPITQRYVAEAASLYNRPVRRWWVNAKTKDEDEEATKAINDHLRAAGYDQALQQIDQITTLTTTAGRWDQVRRGQVRPRVVTPNVIWSVPNPEIPYPDRTDIDDYFGFVVQLTNSATKDDPSEQYVLISHAEHIYYKGQSWHEIDTTTIERHTNPYTWDQFVEVFDGGVPTGQGGLQEHPLQMLTFWHMRKPLDEIIIQTDPEIAILNREINIVWSVVMDIIRTQSHGQMVMNLDNKDNPPPRMAYGSRFGLMLNTEESVSFETVSHNYTDLVAALQSVVGLYAVAKRLSPNDFAVVEARAPASGFAKMIDSLPKIEARAERITEQKRKEEEESWPRLGAELQSLGVITNAKELEMRVEFSDLAFPRTVKEETEEAEFEFKHGLDSPVEMLARKQGIDREEAQKIIDDNKPAPEAPGGGARGRFGQTIGKRAGSGAGIPGQEKQTDDDDDGDSRAV